MYIVYTKDSLHEKSVTFLRGVGGWGERTVSKCRLLTILPGVLSIKRNILSCVHHEMGR